MNWRISGLDSLNLVSFSDSHSFWPFRLGREATVFEFNKLTYANIINAIRTGNGLKMTIEVDPSYGKYHFDGHRACNVVMEPKESTKLNKICPICKKPLTIGVLNRIEELADRDEGYIKPDGKPFLRMLPLHEIISNLKSMPLNSKKTWEIFYTLLSVFGNEFEILLNADREKIAKLTDIGLADAIISNRQGKIKVIPGYDGVYGQPVLGKELKDLPKKEEKMIQKRNPIQKGLNDFLS
jgi:uncharacterized protein (TIGR00375 family)